MTQLYFFYPSKEEGLGTPLVHLISQPKVRALCHLWFMIEGLIHQAIHQFTTIVLIYFFKKLVP